MNCDALSGGGGSRWMQMPNPSASAATSSSSSATSSSASGASQNVGPIPSGVGFPGLPPMGVPPMPMPPGATPADILPVDPCLPCHSRHFVNRRAQMAAGQSAGAEQVTVLTFSTLLYSLFITSFFFCFSQSVQESTCLCMTV